MYLIYSAVFAAGAALIAPFYAWRYRKNPLLWKAWRDRLGWINVYTAKPGTAIWVHAVSVGETLAAAPLIERLAAAFPEREIFLSHVTPTGRETGEKRLPGVAGRFFLPLDLAGAMRRVMRRLRPRLVILVETEIWPNLLRAARERGTRVAIVNARLSDRSARGYRLARPLMRRVLMSVDLILAQTPADAERFRDIGAAPERVITAGNLKFDSRPPASCAAAESLKSALALAGRGPVLAAASTMPGEEELVLSAWASLQRRYGGALLILAPRHPARFDQVARLLAAKSSFLRRTQMAAGPRELARQVGASGAPLPEVFLLDTLGELPSFFALAGVVFIGGSLVPTGGHNLLEPAWWGKPVIFGPHMENFRAAAQLFLNAGAAVEAADAGALASEAAALFDDEERRRAMGLAARAVVEQQSGATERAVKLLAPLLANALAPGQPARPLFSGEGR